MTTFEAEYYESDHWWSNGMLEDSANILRMTRTAELIPSDAETLLDAGCGNGVFAKIAKQKRHDLRISCTDRSLTALRHVIADEVTRSDITELPFENEKFDCVSCLEVLEHLNQRDFPLAIREIARVAKKHILIGVPFNEAIEKNTSKCPACYTVFNADLHLRKFTLDYFTNLFVPHGFKLTSYMHPVPTTHYLGFRTYYYLRRLISAQQKTTINSICPVCGFLPPNVTTHSPTSDSLEHSPLTISSESNSVTNTGSIRQLIKPYWPKQTTSGYWIVGLYSRDP
jgi:ubiquinone/menaquinone biosynthesis C-methylase UbiE